MRFILPLFLLIIAGGLFFGFTSPLFGEIDSLRLSEASLTADLEEARKVKDNFDKLNQAKNNIDPADMVKLESLLPNKVDTVDLLVMINNIAKQSAMGLSDVNITTSEGARSSRQPATSKTVEGLGTVNFSFSVEGSYAALKKFLYDLERSLRLVDIDQINFTAVDQGNYIYDISLKTYWLK